jgi:hypothetical protein
MSKHGTDIGAEWQVVQRLDIFRGRRPGLLVFQRTQNELARHGFHPAEQVGGVVGVGVHRREGAVTEQDRGDAVPDRLSQPGVQQDLGVVVGVHVDESGHNPLAGGVDHIGAARLVQRPSRHRGHDAVANAQRADLGRSSGPVEPQAVADDDVVGHDAHPTIKREYSQSFFGSEVVDRPGDALGEFDVRRPSEDLLGAAVVQAGPLQIAQPRLVELGFVATARRVGDQ